MAMRSISNFERAGGSSLSASGGASLSASETSRLQPPWSPVRRGYSASPDLMGSVRNVGNFASLSGARPTTASGSLSQRPAVMASAPIRTRSPTVTSSVLAPSAAVTQAKPLGSTAPAFQTREAVVVSTGRRPKAESQDETVVPAPTPEVASDVAALFVAGAVRTASVDEGEQDLLTNLAAAEEPLATANGKAAPAVAKEVPPSTVPSTAATRFEPRPCSDVATIRLQRPHGHFPFDIFSGKNGWKNLLARGGYGLPEELLEELGYVQTHCMTPPFPWGQIIYHDLVMKLVIEGGVEGDFAEFGIGLGGTSVFFARMAKKYGRKFLAVDSFEGLPEPDAVKDNHYFLQGDYCPPSGEDNYDRWMQYNSRFDVDDVLYTRKCFFKDLEIPNEFEKFAFVHLDSDLYDSVYDSLEKVWDRMPDGGIIAIDDFFHHAQGPARAVADFFRVRCSEDEPPLLYVVPCYAVLVVKGRSACLWNPGDPDDASQKRMMMHSPRALDGNFYSFKLIRQCTPLIMATEHSVQRIRETMQHVQSEEEMTALSRCLTNAESFLGFLRYPENASRSGSDILRFLLPLEDTWDIQQGKLCGLPGEARGLIQIQI